MGRKWLWKGEWLGCIEDLHAKEKHRSSYSRIVRRLVCGWRALRMKTAPRTSHHRNQAAIEPVCVSFSNVSVVFPGQAGHLPVQALDNISLDVRDQEFVSLIGPSGCGKSTLLRVISDIIPPTTGNASIKGRRPKEARLAREIGFVFQDAALLEWRRILDNVALPLEL